MFNSPKIGDSPSVTSLHKTVNDTANGIPRSFLQPKVTSTPLGRRDCIFATPPKPHPLTPRRYSLSEIATPPRTNKRDLTKIHATGPLLTSTKYNLNVSTYEDTKSPGLASRIVQYNEEAEKERERQRTPTHQAKYGSPGMFPVVHLFKKKLPVLEQKPRRVTIRIASPEYLRQHSQDYNRRLLEGIIKPNLSSSSRHLLAPQGDEHNNSSTRSVLDALKEISRKRIHANEEYETNEDSGKRIRTESFSDTDTNKRLREDSPLLNNSSSPNKTAPKRICMYDEYAASCSSMNFLLKKSEQPIQKRKSISISTLTENPKETKQVKLINVETQTVTDEDDKKNTQTNDSSETELNKIKNQIDDDKPVKRTSPVKIFDDAPLERIRKNRLAALMGSLAGKDPVLAPKPDFASALNSRLQQLDTPVTTDVEVSSSVDKPLVSILASPKKDSPSRHNKHVHFSLPESISQTIITTPSIISFPITQNSASITAPISSTCEVKSSFTANKNEEKLETPAPPSSPVGLSPSSSDMLTSVAPAVFDIKSNSSSTMSVVSKESSASSLGIDISKSIPTFQFKSPTTSSTALGNVSSAMSFTGSSPVPSLTTFGGTVTSAPTSTPSPPKAGGFKFDLSKPVSVSSAVATSSMPTFSFGVASHNKSLFGPITTTAASNSVSTSGSTLGSFSFGSKSTSTDSAASTVTVGSFSTNPAFENPTTSLSIPVSNTSTISTFKFGAGNLENKPGTGFGLPTTSSVNFGSNNAPTFSFGAKTSTTQPASTVSVAAVPAFSTSKSPIFSFGTAPSKASSFGTPTTTSASLTFGAPLTSVSSGLGSTSSSGFGPPSSSFGAPSSGFGVTTTSSTVASFGAPTNASSGGFGTTTSGGFGTTTSGGFGTTTSGGFGTTTSGGFSTTTSGGFGTTASSTTGGNFGTTTAPMFGDNKSASQFGVTTSTTTPTFGTPSASSSSPFGKSSTPAFGQSITQPSFGNPTTTVSFGTVNAFGKPSNTASIFGGVATTQASGFGATNSKPLFGAATTSPFGSAPPATTTPAFGSGTMPAFNFGAKTTASGTFGSGNVFGTTTTTASTGFGTSTTPAFGTSNAFGSGSSSFGTNNTFGSSTAPTFGAATTTTQSTGFGTSNTASAFGSPSTNFGANNKGSVFGSSSTPAFGSSTTTPSFGATAPATGFGITNSTSGFATNSGSAFAKSQTTFGPSSNTFGATTNFGANQAQAAGFGPANPPNTQTPVFSFGAAAPPKPPGVFSFGASSSEPLKPTFNFTGGSSAPSFGSTGALPFGSTGTPSFGAAGIPQFNPPQPAAPGMFSIGSGSSSGRTRTQLKAKRRI